MGKFFKREPKICSICRVEGKPIKKRIRTQDGKFYYCEDCYKDFYDNLKPRITAAVIDRAKQGQKIGLKETQELVQKLTEETNKELNQDSR